MVDTRKLGYSPDWNRLSTSTGYRVIYCPDHPFAWSTGYVYVHRIIAEIKIGRILQPEEKVHHINENKKDNSPENIKILTQSEHSKLHKTTGIIYVTFNCTFCNKTFSRKNTRSIKVSNIALKNAIMLLKKENQYIFLKKIYLMEFMENIEKGVDALSVKKLILIDVENSNAPVVQWIEHKFPKFGVVRSIRTGGI